MKYVLPAPEPTHHWQACAGCGDFSVPCDCCGTGLSAREAYGMPPLTPYADAMCSSCWKNKHGGFVNRIKFGKGRS
jgi:hypothetical protein